MKVFLNSNVSVLEYLYLDALTKSQAVDSTAELVNDLHKANLVVGCNKQDLFYDKTIIINNESYDKDNLTYLSKHNKIVSRFNLPVGIVEEYSLEPYEDIQLNGFRFNGYSNDVMSKLSINSFLLLKDDKGYYMKQPKMFMPVKVSGKMNILGLLQRQIEKCTITKG